MTGSPVSRISNAKRKRPPGIQQWREDALLDVALKLQQQPSARGAAQGGLQPTVDLELAVELADADIDSLVRALAEAKAQRDVDDERRARTVAGIDIHVEVQAQRREMFERVENILQRIERRAELQRRLLELGKSAAGRAVVRLDRKERAERTDVDRDVVLVDADIPRRGRVDRIDDAGELRARSKRTLDGPLAALGEIVRRRNHPEHGIGQTPVVRPGDVELRGVLATRGRRSRAGTRRWTGPTRADRPPPARPFAGCSARPDRSSASGTGSGWTRWTSAGRIRSSGLSR